VYAHEDRFGGIRVLYPPGSSWDPRNLVTDTDLAIVGVAVGDVATAQAELRARFGPNVCAVRVPRTVAEQNQVFGAVSRLQQDPHTGIYGVGREFAAVLARIAILDETRYAMLTRIGLDCLSLEVWLRPVAGGSARGTAG
jgi:hypothetical protein